MKTNVKCYNDMNIVEKLLDDIPLVTPLGIMVYGSIVCIVVCGILWTVSFIMPYINRT